VAADARQREDAREREVVTFFASLAKRRRREVDLSDVTYAVLQALPVLRRDFARFFGVPVQEHDHIILEREVAVHGGLADFLFEGPTWKLLVENKINDRNYHVDQYELRDVDQKTPYYGLIAAHRVDPDQLTEAKKWTIRHWDEWLEVLRKQGWASHPLVAGYIAYVQEVCRLLPPVEPFTLDPSGVSALGRFYLLLEHVLNQSVETPEYTRDWRRWDCNRFGAGAYLTLGKPGPDGARKFPVWFGLLYERCALGGEVEQRLLPQEVWRGVDRLTHELTTQGWEAWHYGDGVVYWAPKSLEQMNERETAAEKKRLVEELLDVFCRAVVSIA